MSRNPLGVPAITPGPLPFLYVEHTALPRRKLPRALCGAPSSLVRCPSRDILDLTVTENIRLNANYVLLKLTSQSLLPEMLPGQFAELRVDGSPTTFLRRPISINFVDKQRNEVWFLIQLVGDGTRRLAEVNPGIKS